MYRNSRKTLNLSFIFFCGHTRYFFENDVEVFYVVEAAKQSDLLVGKAAADQELLRAFDPFGICIYGRCTSVRLIKQLVEIGAADIRRFTYLFP